MMDDAELDAGELEELLEDQKRRRRHLSTMLSNYKASNQLLRFRLSELDPDGVWKSLEDIVGYDDTYASRNWTTVLVFVSKYL